MTFSDASHHPDLCSRKAINRLLAAYTRVQRTAQHLENSDAKKYAVLLFAGMLSFFGVPGLHSGEIQGQTPSKPYLVEWVYRVKYGYQDEWWKIFAKYQIATLDKEKELGYVTSYEVVRPGLHTSEESRWDYRIVIAYKDGASATHGGEVEKSLFPDTDARKKEENRRWELTTNHWDLPIREIDPHATE